MMSHHLNSMLGHFKMPSLKKPDANKKSDETVSQNGNSIVVIENHVESNATQSTQIATIEKNHISDAATVTANLNHVNDKNVNNNNNHNHNNSNSNSNNNNNNNNSNTNNNNNFTNNNNINNTAANAMVNGGGGGGGGGGSATPVIEKKKRNSICVLNSQTVDGKNLSPRASQRKLSQDMRFKGIDGFDEGGLQFHIKPVKLKTVSSKAEAYDTLYCKSVTQPTNCTRDICLGSVMNTSLVGCEPRKPDIILTQAKDFLEQYFTSIRRLKSPAHDARWTQIQKEIESTGSYQLTETELIYGAKLAWRNSSRCIGRIQWSKLQLFDCRYVTTTSGMFEAICNHIKYATNKGNLRSAITIFPQRTDGRHDFRIWNPQLISYAGYRNNDGSVIGDPMNVEITDICLKLGWKGKRTEWDILPLVLSANGHDPDYFDYPPDLIVEIPLEHPSYKWFADFKLRWYALPAVSNMLFDCGGIQFTATAFSGWYMATEIGCRNLGDTNRRNLIEPVALKMGLDTRTTTSLWKDKALVEMNIAVLYSFQSKNITIVDHHTASESFMKHLENETKLRNGCPADWVWIVPPMSSSLTPVFHQEMALYFLKPSFEYQEQAWKTHIWKKGRDSAKTKKPRRKFHFKQIARAVKFTSKLFGRALSRRIKATVLYATETGKSEQYAKQLGELLSHAFNAQVYCMSDYDISSIEHEALLFVVASTFGNGDPPENGESFAQDLYAMKLQESGDVFNNKILSVAASSKSFIKANSRSDMVRGGIQNFKKIDRLDSLRGSTSDNTVEETFGPLSNVRFAIFALGSSAYPNFCAFGKYIDNILGELGGERIMRLAIGDEMCGQEQEFRKWAPEVFKLACETFCLDNDDTFSDASFALENDSLTVNTIRFTSITSNQTLAQSLEKYHNKKIMMCKLKNRPTNLSTELNAAERSTILVEILSNEIEYEPGDHVGIIPMNRKQIVDGILSKLVGVDDPDEIIQLQILKEYHTSNGISKAWEPHERIPPCSLRILLSQFLDITTPPSRKLLTLLATFCDDKQDIDRLNILANESSAYEDWRHWRLPHLLEVLDEFPSCKPPASLIVASLMPLQPRFYSISSSQLMYRNEMHLTVGIVKYRTEDDEGAEHYGVCSNYLEGLNENDSIFLFVRNAPLFRVPEDTTRPIIMIGPGTGIAPFRGFWQHWHMKQRDYAEPIPKAWLLFGCRKNYLDLYREEKNEMSEAKVLDRVFLALSREKNIPKTYVQDLAIKEADSIYDLIVKDNGHVYVCGDVTMAEHVYQTLRKIIAEKEQKSEFEIEKFMMNLRDENRYHEDIFGITLRTAEIHNKSRASARIRMASQP